MPSPNQRATRATFIAALVFAVATPALAIPASTLVPIDYAQKFIKRSKSYELPSRSGISVRDTFNSQVLVYNRATEPHLPASVMKIVTATVALQTYGPEHQLQTRAVWDETTKSLFIVGAGDPVLTGSKIRSLARKAAMKLSSTTGRIKVFYDDSLFDAFTMPRGWPGFYVPRYVRPLSALAIFDSNSRTPAKETASTFAAALRDNGIRAVLKGSAVATGIQVSRVPSAKMSLLVKEMLEPSDNNSAETLHWLSAAKNGGPANWRTAAQHSRATLRQLGINLTGWKIVDGSGLSRNNRLTSDGLTELLLKALLPENPNLNSILADGLLPLGGEEGTLKTRFQQNRSKCAAKFVEAKTGTLFDTVALAGYVRTVDGGLAAFAVLANEVSSRSRTNQVRARIDYMVTALSGCDAVQPVRLND